jgi:hypothetical protein
MPHLHLTDFLNRTFAGENAQNRAFCGGEKLKAVRLYHAAINDGAALREINALFTRFP